MGVFRGILGDAQPTRIEPKSAIWEHGDGKYIIARLHTNQPSDLYGSPAESAVRRYVPAILTFRTNC
jgi:hypothetical protein